MTSQTNFGTNENSGAVLAPLMSRGDPAMGAIKYVKQPGPAPAPALQNNGGQSTANATVVQMPALAPQPIAPPAPVNAAGVSQPPPPMVINMQQQQQMHNMQQQLHTMQAQLQQKMQPKLIPMNTRPKVPAAAAAAATTVNHVPSHAAPNGTSSASVVGTDPGTLRTGGGGGQLLQFPWKLHEMLHLAEKNGKTDIISWLPGGNGFKVHNKELFCEEIMPGYFASQKYKTFQRSLNLWGFESVAKGPDRGACYHQYFVKGHPELCHSMTRVKIKGQSNPRTPAAAQAAAAAAAKRAALSSFANQQHQQQAVTAPVPHQQQQQHQQPINMMAINQFMPTMPGVVTPIVGIPNFGMQMNGATAASATTNPYAFAAMNQFVTMNALQQMNPTLAAAAMQNPAMNAMLTAQVAAAAAIQAQATQLQQQQALGADMAAGQQVAPSIAPPTTPFSPVGPQYPPPMSSAPTSTAAVHPEPAPTATVPTSTSTTSKSNSNGLLTLSNANGNDHSSEAKNKTQSNADANFAEYLARKSAMDRHIEQLSDPSAPVPTVAASNNNNKKTGSTNSAGSDGAPVAV